MKHTSFSVIFSQCYSVILGHEDIEVFLLLLWWHWRNFQYKYADKRHPLPVSLYCISSLLRYYLCPCMHTMSMLSSAADVVSSFNWPILFKVLTLNVAMLTVFALDLSLSSVADFLNTGARVPTSAECYPLFSCLKVNVAWTFDSI